MRSVAVWLIAVGLLAGCGLETDSDPGTTSANAFKAALTHSQTSSESAFVGLLTFDVNLQRKRCPATLIGARTLITAMSCLLPEHENYRFQIGGLSYAISGNPAGPPNQPYVEAVRFPSGGGYVERNVWTNNIGILRLENEPPSSIPRVSVTQQSLPGPFRLLTHDGATVRKTEQSGELSVGHPTTRWYVEDTFFQQTGIGGIFERSDLGGPTLYFVSGSRVALVGIHAAAIPVDNEVRAAVGVDVRVSPFVEALRTAADGDLCIEGRLGRFSSSSVVCLWDTSSPAGCGDGVRDSTQEQCDDGDLDFEEDGCSRQCTVQSGYRCQEDANGLSVCQKYGCGDGIRGFSEECDDGNTVNGDGCSAVCTLEVRDIESKCGNRRLDGSEECDDGNALVGDGCSARCFIESGFVCLQEDIGTLCFPETTRVARTTRRACSAGGSLTPDDAFLGFAGGLAIAVWLGRRRRRLAQI